MKITFLDAKTVGALPELNDLELLGDLQVFQNTKASETFKRIQDSEIVITNKVIIDKKIIKKADKLKLICVAATGTNNIDLKAAEEKDIQVKNVKGYSTHSVAQHTFSMIFYLLNHISYYDRFVKSKKYSRSDIFTCLDKNIFELKDKVFGIIGLGTIGKEVAKVAEAFGAEVIYYSTSGKNSDPVYKRTELDDLLKTSDVISIHAPLNEKTKNLLGLAQFKLMKQSAILVNTGRGGIIIEKDLVKALNQNLISGAAIDVYEKEPIGKSNPFMSIKNKEKLLLTPHIAWASVEARKELLKGVYDNIREYLNSRT
ncbi:MAG: D-2-hydroxyacid dehydrogenase [Cytophagaceae bacterium]|nr:D-2-hydroxyacid dehydrogenase [Cytophagaceae bacterium]